MKKVFFITAIISIFIVLTAFTTSNTNFVKTEIIWPNDYCEGWEDGYCEGWKDVKGQFTICPIPPICPIPEPGNYKYRDGYNRGFKAGSRAAQR